MALVMCNRAWFSGSKCSSFRSLLFKSCWVNSDLQWTGPYGYLVPRSPISGSLGTLPPCPVTSASHTHTQGSFIGDCHSYEETQVGQEIMPGCPASSQNYLGIMCLPLDLTPSWHLFPQKALQMTKTTQSFFPSFQAPTHPPPSCTSSSFQEHLCIPSYISPTPSFIPSPRSFLILTSKPTSLISSPLLQSQAQTSFPWRSVMEEKGQGDAATGLLSFEKHSTC